jgi:RNA polymerase sigma-70 factor (ECF subfamily)
MNPDSPQVFQSTMWTVVLCARDGDESVARRALETLCTAYWYPLYGFARRAGLSHEDSQDAVQSSFVYLFEGDYLARVRREAGKFRSFLLAYFRNFLTDQRGRAAAAKRGGGASVISLDFGDAAARYACEVVDQSQLTPERWFARQWAIELLARARTLLREECVRDGREELRAALQPDTGGPAVSYAEIAQRFGLTEGGVKTHAFRFRRRYQELILEEVAHTVGSRGKAEEELRELLAALD